jgi:hypothetical protein
MDILVELLFKKMFEEQSIAPSPLFILFVSHLSLDLAVLLPGVTFFRSG